MSRHGLLLVAWAWPDDITTVLPPEWLQMYLTRKTLGRPPKVVWLSCGYLDHHGSIKRNDDENEHTRKRNRETGITLVNLKDLTDDEWKYCRGPGDQCMVIPLVAQNIPRASILWLKGAGLPAYCPEKIDLEHAKSSWHSDVLNGVRTVWQTFMSTSTLPGTKRRRRVNNVYSQIKDACDQANNAEDDKPSSDPPSCFALDTTTKIKPKASLPKIYNQKQSAQVTSQTSESPNRSSSLGPFSRQLREYLLRIDPEQKGVPYASVMHWSKDFLLDNPSTCLQTRSVIHIEPWSSEERRIILREFLDESPTRISNTYRAGPSSKLLRSYLLRIDPGQKGVSYHMRP